MRGARERAYRARFRLPLEPVGGLSEDGLPEFAKTEWFEQECVSTCVPHSQRGLLSRTNRDYPHTSQNPRPADKRNGLIARHCARGIERIQENDVRHESSRNRNPVLNGGRSFDFRPSIRTSEGRPNHSADERIVVDQEYFGAASSPESGDFAATHLKEPDDFTPRNLIIASLRGAYGSPDLPVSYPDVNPRDADSQELRHLRNREEKPPIERRKKRRRFQWQISQESFRFQRRSRSCQVNRFDKQCKPYEATKRNNPLVSPTSFRSCRGRRCRHGTPGQ